MTHRPRRPRAAASFLAVCLALAVVPLTGCGGSDVNAKNAYVDQVNRVQQRFATTFESLAGQITATSSAQEDRRTLQNARQALDSAVTDLRKVKPPKEVATLHAELAGTVESYGHSISEATDALASKDPAARAKATATLAQATSRTSADVSRTIEAINQKLRG